MNWKDLEEDIGKAAPVLGGLIGGPAGAGIGAIVASVLGVGNTPQEVSQALKTDPDAAVKLRQIEADETLGLKRLAVEQAANDLAADTARIQAVNATMQAEAKADHWPSYSWRPFIGFITGVMVFGCYFVLPLISKPVPAVPESVWLMLGGILGIASFFRGKAQADPGIPTDNRG